MFDLVENPEEWFSHVAAQLNCFIPQGQPERGRNEEEAGRLPKFLWTSSSAIYGTHGKMQGNGCLKWMESCFEIFMQIGIYL